MQVRGHAGAADGAGGARKQLGLLPPGADLQPEPRRDGKGAGGRYRGGAPAVPLPPRARPAGGWAPSAPLASIQHTQRARGWGTPFRWRHASRTEP
eukprot:1180517-Prorocentrum_minimum.AAC.2